MQEQKLSDIAGCLADVLRCTAGDTSATFQEGKHHLSTLLSTLSRMRGKESRYLKPLMSKMDGLVGYDLNHLTLPLPSEEFPAGMQEEPYLMPPGPRFSITDSVGMLRTLSMSGNLGMPTLRANCWELEQRRPSGRVYDEFETGKVMGEELGYA